MDKGLFLIETRLKTGRPIGELAKAHGVSRGWLYKLLRRYRLEGPSGLELRSRRRTSAVCATPTPSRFLSSSHRAFQAAMNRSMPHRRMAAPEEG